MDNAAPAWEPPSSRIPFQAALNVTIDGDFQLRFDRVKTEVDSKKVVVGAVPEEDIQ